MLLKPITELRYISVTIRVEQDVIDRVRKIGITEYIKELLEDHNFDELNNSDVSLEPWLYDPAISHEEAMFYKLKDKCHVCGVSPRFHRDDCPYSMNQLYFAELEKHDLGLTHINHYINALIGELNIKGVKSK